MLYKWNIDSMVETLWDSPILTEIFHTKQTKTALKLIAKTCFALIGR